MLRDEPHLRHGACGHHWALEKHLASCSTINSASLSPLSGFVPVLAGNRSTLKRVELLVRAGLKEFTEITMRTGTSNSGSSCTPGPKGQGEEMASLEPVARRGGHPLGAVAIERESAT